jgi:hypothetical protein
VWVAVIVQGMALPVLTPCAKVIVCSGEEHDPSAAAGGDKTPTNGNVIAVARSRVAAMRIKGRLDEFMLLSRATDSVGSTDRLRCK